jgi:hypothetical protein
MTDVTAWGVVTKMAAANPLASYFSLISQPSDYCKFVPTSIYGQMYLLMAFEVGTMKKASLLIFVGCY